MRREIEKLLAPGSADELWDNFVTLMRELGFAHTFYSARRFADMARLWLTDELEWRSTFPVAFLDELNGTVPRLTESPWGLWSRENEGSLPCNWVDSPEAEPYLTPDNQRLIALMRQHGVFAGQMISLLGLSARVTGTIVLSTGDGTDQADADALWQKVGRDVMALSGVFHLRACALPQTKGRARLTPRQREVVEWAAYGKTVSEIAEILGVGPTTIEKHLRLARDALDAHTTAQAILKAHQRNQIFIRPVEMGGSG
ncbi:LuxR family transcriptional regulator [uncultured Paracoccus sp.]|uniref:helix-turn-helix transcriptional regulator n=1 Tax=uncultured Paracoccus sp. TaxID=189685 RepID=UPI002618F47F|nr:LuxR family transcriptional regulator [uncultured Paracoccus sp.]